MALKFLSNTPFTFAPLVGRMNFPGYSLTLIVKACFDLSPGKEAEAGEEQPFPNGDQFYADDDEMRGGPRFESDFAWFKPRADLLLVGKCHAPGNSPARTCPVNFRVGSRSKSLAVAGNRRWESRGLRCKATEPEPFTEMELRYENSYGGKECGKNPVGKGQHPFGNDQGREIWPLPNIEDAAQQLESPEDRPEPAGLGPLNRIWETRRAKIGTYGSNYAGTRWPWFPEDFDWSHFNAAPDDMQIEGYLKGDEDLYFENLHPIHAEYHSRLPGLRVRCFLNRRTPSDGEDCEFMEVRMNLDTLWVDMESEKLVLVWRGWSAVLSEDYEEVQDVFIFSEPLTQNPASLEECRRQFLDMREKDREAGAMGTEASPAEAQQPEDAAGPSTTSGMQSGDLDPVQLQAQANSLLAQMGVDPETLPPEIKEKQGRLMRKLTTSDRSKVFEIDRQELEAEMRQALHKLKLDPDHLPSMSAKAKTEQLRFMKELGLKPADVAATPEMAGYWALMGAILPKAGMDPENLDPLIAQARKQRLLLEKQFQLDNKDEIEANPEAPPLTRELVRERAARGESFAGQDLQGLDLSGLELKGIDFSGTNLAGAVLDGANLEAANFAGADLTGTRLEKACAKDADFTGSILVQAILAGAALTDAVFEKAQMAGAALDGVDAGGADFSGADLTEARFRESACPRADFSNAVLDKANFQKANLREASMDGATGRQINMADADCSGLRASEGCDFGGGNFRKAVGPDSIWEGAILAGADFRGASMQGATFTAACLKQSDLSYADMKFSRFYKADLTQARMVRMNLFQASLEKADLSGADLSESNMYGVEFLNAVADAITTNGTNLKMTKLHKK